MSTGKSEPSKAQGAQRGRRVPDGMCGRSQACRATAKGRAYSLARRSGRIRKLVCRLYRATDAPLLVTAPLRAGDEELPTSVTSGGAGGGAHVHMGLSSLSPPRGASVMSAT